MFLQLHDKMKNCSKNGQQIKWEMPQLELPSNCQVALSSLAMDFSNPENTRKPVTIMTNLIEADIYNQDGVIITNPNGSQRHISHFSNILEFWRVDSIRPRFISFKFKDVPTNLISHFSVVLAFKTCPD